MLTIIGLEKVGWISEAVPNIGLNVTFMVFGAAGLAFNIFTRWVYTSPLSAALIYQPRFDRPAERCNVFEQLFKRVQEPATERTEPVHAAVVLASIPGDGASADLLVIASKCGRFRDHLLGVAGAVLVCLGSHVRASSGEDHPCARHQDRVSFGGPYLDMERNWCAGCESPQDTWPVRIPLTPFGIVFGC